MTSLIAKSIVDAWVDGFGFLVFPCFTLRVKPKAENWSSDAEFLAIHVKISKKP